MINIVLFAIIWYFLNILNLSWTNSRNGRPNIYDQIFYGPIWGHLGPNMQLQWLRSVPLKIGQSRKIAFFSLFLQNCQPLSLIKSHLLFRRPEMNTGGRFYHFFWNKVLTMLWPSENWPKKKNACWRHSSSEIAGRWLGLIKSYLLFQIPQMNT